jgi:hypothetical protein
MLIQAPSCAYPTRSRLDGSKNPSTTQERDMRFYTNTHKHYCGIDLHARTMYVCILDSEGTILLHRNMPCDPEKFLRAIAPYRDDLVVAVECMFTWYWLADLCAREGIAFVLGHALYMKAIHGAKAKNDKIDSLKISSPIVSGEPLTSCCSARSASPRAKAKLASWTRTAGSASA